MKQYLALLQYIINNGVQRQDRTNTGTLSVFGYQMRFELNREFPLVTTKKIYLPGVIHELLWFLSGETNIRYLIENNVRIWNEWADAEGNLGPVYGSQWRSWATAEGGSIDQISQVIDSIKTNPYSRRHLVSAWNVGELDKMALLPCHVVFQFYVADDRLSCMLTQRSADVFLGVPFNIASYSLLTCMVAQQCGLEPHEFIWNGGDCHLYLNHLEQASLQLSRQPFSLPRLVIKRKPSDIFSYSIDDFAFENYQHHPAIKAKIAI